MSSALCKAAYEDYTENLIYGEINKPKGYKKPSGSSSLSCAPCSTVAHLQIYEWAHPVWVSPIVMMKWHIFQNEQV